jgi:putative alpha-1,2-mannosidase
MYGSDKYGLAFPGMDDQGSTASWYVMSAMGFYTVDPSSPDYMIGSPIFSHVKVHLENGKDFVIIAHNNSAKNVLYSICDAEWKAMEQTLVQSL